MSRTPEGGTLRTLTASPGIDGKYVMKLFFEGGSHSFTIEQPPAEWLSGGGSWDTAGRDGVETFDYGEPIVFRRMRLANKVTGGISSDELSRGLLVWIVLRRK